MNIGTAIGLISMVATFFGTVWRLKAEQGQLRQDVETRLTKIETNISWVVNQTRHYNEFCQYQFLKNKDDRNKEESDDAGETI